MLELLSGIHIGPFLIKYSWIGAALGFFSASFHIQRLYKQNNQELSKKLVDLFWNAVLIWILSYKLAKAVFAPSAFFSNPILEFLGPPAPNADILAWTIVIGYLFYKWHRLKIPFLQFCDSLIPTCLLGLGVYSLFSLQLGTATHAPWGVQVGLDSYHPVNFYKAIVLLFAYPIIMYFSKNKNMPGTLTATSLIILGLTYELSTFFLIPNRLYIGLTADQWLYFVILLTGVFLFYQTSSFSKAN